MSYSKAVVALALAILVIVAMAPKASDNAPKIFSSEQELKSFLAQADTYGTMYTSRGVMEAATSGSNLQKSADYSSTNVQVQGVDEADIVKNDGKYIYSVSGNKLFITDAYPAQDMKLLSSIEFANATPQEIYVAGDRLVVFGSSYNYGLRPLGVETAAVAKIGIVAPFSQKAFIKVYDISDRANPVILRDDTVDGYYATSRMTDGQVYAIINMPAYKDQIPIFSPGQQGFPEIYYFGMPDYSYTYTNIISFDPQAGEMKNNVFLSGYSMATYVSQDNIYLAYQKQVSPYYAQDRIINEIIIPSLGADAAANVRDIMASNMHDYEKQNAIYAAIANWTASLSEQQAKGIQARAEAIQKDAFVESQKTVIHRISISNGNIEYAANGEVPGAPLNQFSMDEHDGYFRIATTTSSYWGFGSGIAFTKSVSSTGAAGMQQTVSNVITAQSGAITTTPQYTGIAQNETAQNDAGDSRIEKPLSDRPVQELLTEPPMPRDETKNNVYVLGMGMNVVGKLEGLAEGERIYSARFMGDRAYLVTFRQTDPLFAIDMSKPANPRVLGELKIPGVSEYLHPYGENYLIGLGHDATDGGRLKGLKLSLFDVSDVSSPREVSAEILGGAGSFSYAAYDHKAFLFSAEKGLLVIPAYITEGDYKYSWQGAYVFGVSEAGFALKGKIAHEYNVTQNDYYQSQDAVRRALYMDDALYTVSDGEIKATGLATMEEISNVKLPVNPPVYYIM